MRLNSTNIIWRTCVISTLLVVSACATSETKPNSRLTFGNVKENIVKGQTSQAEVLQTLGSPNLVTKDRAGKEVWTYSRQSYDSESGAFGGGIILVGGSKAFHSSASSTFDLFLTFNDKDIVDDYSVVVSQY